MDKVKKSTAASAATETDRVMIPTAGTFMRARNCERGACTNDLMGFRVASVNWIVLCNLLFVYVTISREHTPSERSRRYDDVCSRV